MPLRDWPEGMNALEERVILLSLQMALAIITKFLDEICHQWLHYGPKGHNGQPRNARQQQATEISQILEALDVNDIRNYPSRASSLGEVPKRKNDVFDVRQKASTDAKARRSRLAPRMPNRLAYLSG